MRALVWVWEGVGGRVKGGVSAIEGGRDVRGGDNNKQPTGRGSMPSSTTYLRVGYKSTLRMVIAPFCFLREAKAIHR